MTKNPLPDTLPIGCRICQCKYAPTEILEVFKVDDTDPGRVYLCRENGVVLQCSQRVELLRDFDYELVTETTN